MRVQISFKHQFVLFQKTLEVNENEFVTDSGLIHHIVFNRNLFVDFREKDEIVLSPNANQSQISEVDKDLSMFFTRQY